MFGRHDDAAATTASETVGTAGMPARAGRFAASSSAVANGDTLVSINTPAPDGDSEAPTQAFRIPQQRQQQPWAGPPPCQAGPVEPPKRRRRWPWIVAGVFAFLVVVGSFGADGAPAAVPPQPAAVSAFPFSVPAAPRPQPAEAAAASGPVEEGSSAVNTGAGSWGDELTANGLTLTVSEPEEVNQPYLGTQVCSTVTYTNNGATSESFNLFDWNLRTSAGVEARASIPFNSDDPLNSGRLAPGGTVSGQVCGDNTIDDVSAVVYSPGFGIMNELVWS